MTSEKMQPATIDRVHTLLSDSRRRYLLYALSESGRHTVDELARRLLERERTGPTSAGASTGTDTGAESKRERIVAELVHKHLPRLDDHDVVDYCADRETVELGIAFDDVEPFLEHARSIEQPSHLRSEPADHACSGGVTD